MALEGVQSSGGSGASPVQKPNKKGHNVRFAEPHEKNAPSVKATPAGQNVSTTPIQQVVFKRGAPPLVRGKGLYVVKLSTKQRKKLARDEIKQRNEQIKVLKSKVQAQQAKLKETTRSGRTYLKVGNWQWKAKKKAPISDRMTAYLEVQKLKKDIRAEKRAIGKLKQFVKNPIRKGVDNVIDSLFASRAEYRGIKSKTGAKPILPKNLIAQPGTPTTAKLPTPWLWYKVICEGLLGLIRSSKQACLSHSQNKALHELVKDGASRLRDIAEEKKGAIGDPDRLCALQTEENELRGQVNALRQELERLTVVEDTAGLALAGMSTTFDISALVQTFSILIPHWIEMGKYASYFGYIGIGASIFTIPLAIVFTTLGASSTIDNLRTSLKDLFYARGFSEQRLGQYHQDMERIDGLLRLPGLSHPALADVKKQMKEASDQIILKRRDLISIESRLADGKEAKSQIKIFKELRDSLQQELADTKEALEVFLQQRLDNCTEEEAPALRTIVAAVNARRVASESALTMQDTIMPHIRQKVTTKVICECVRGIFDVINMVGTSLTVIGFGMTLFGGAGLPIMAVGGAMAIVGGYGQIATSFIIRRLRDLQLRGSAVSSSEFDAAFMARIKEEVANWDALEANSLVDNTNAAVMFSVLKKNYSNLPKHWGPKEWAQAILKDEPGGKERLGYYRALGGMKEHDNFSVMRRVVLWPVRKIRQHHITKMATPAA